MKLIFDLMKNANNKKKLPKINLFYEARRHHSIDKKRDVFMHCNKLFKL